MSIDPRRLVDAHRAVQEALVRDRQLADEEQAISTLVESGVKLASALEEVAADHVFWDRAADSAGRLTGSEEVALASLASGDLAGILVLLGYKPPPPVAEFVDEAVEAIGSALVLDLEPELRRVQIYEAQQALLSFNARLRDLLENRGLVAPVVRRSRLRSYLRRGGNAALAVAPVFAAWGIGTGAYAVGLPGEPIKGIVEVAGVWVAGHLRRLLPERDAETIESIEILNEIDPRTRVLGLAKVAEGRLRRLEAAASISAEALSGLEVALRRAIYAACVHLEQTEETLDRLRRFWDAFIAVREIPKQEYLAELRSHWIDLAQTLTYAPTHAERAAQLEAERLAASAEDTRRLERQRAEDAEAQAKAVHTAAPEQAQQAAQPERTMFQGR